MHINWLGQTCIKIQTKNDEQEAKIVINPYKPDKGNFPRNLSTDIALFSSGIKDSVTLSQNSFIIETSGKFELKNIVVYSIPHQKENLIFKFSTEDMVIVHLGKLNKKIDSNTMEKIMSPDILFIPVGGNDTYLDAKTAAELANELEPRIIIPIGHKCDSDPTADPVSKFVSEIGLRMDNGDNKVIIKKKDLPQEETQLIVLNKEI